MSRNLRNPNPNPIAKSPLIPSSANNSTTYCKSLQVSDLRVQNSVSFYGSDPVAQQTVYPDISSIMTALSNFGLNSLTGYYQQSSKLLGTGGVGVGSQGYALALSTDGNTLAVGGYHDNSDTGAVWVFVKSGTTWTQQGSKLVGTGAVGAANQGAAVSLSADGNTLVSGGPYDDNYIGATWIFTRTNGVWSQQGSKLLANDSIGEAEQATSVALSADGNTLAVGGRYDNNFIGATWIFIRTDETWTQQGSKLIGTGNIGNALQGISVAISLDGDTIAVGGSIDDDYIGATWIFTRTDETWTQQGSKLVGTGYIGTDIYQGYGLALRGDTLVVGGGGDNNYIGATWVFTRTNGVWSQQGSKLIGTGAIGSAEQGFAVSLSDDEQTFITGGGYDNTGIGAVWVFKLVDDVWTQYNEKLVPTGYTGAPGFGYYTYCIAISGDATTIAMGSRDNNGSEGGTWVYISL